MLQINEFYRILEYNIYSVKNLKINMNLKFRRILLLLGDVVIFYIGLYLALLARHKGVVDTELWAKHWPDFSIVFILWILVLYIADFYNLNNAKNNQNFIVRTTLSATILTTVALAYFYIIPNINITPKIVLVLDVIFTTALLTIWRLIFNARAKNSKANIIVLGHSDESIVLLEDIQKNPQWGFNIVAIFDEQAKPNISSFPILSDIKKLKTTLQSSKTKIVIVDDKLYQSPEHIEELFELLDTSVTILPLTSFYEEIAHKIPLNKITKAWFLENISHNTHSSHDKIQRIFDVCLSIIGIAITLPFYPLIAILIKIDSKGTVFYSQKRLGFLGKQFSMFKFRTMITNAEKNGAQWAKVNDIRITKIGKFLRKTRIDEIPQMFNILSGEMSFIGPRAERPEFIEQLEKQIPFYRQRLLIKPGASGWAQVNYKYGSTVEDSLEKLQYDLFYIKNRNWYTDISIILKTIRIMTTGSGN